MTVCNGGQNIAGAGASKLHVLGAVGLMLCMNHTLLNVVKVVTKGILAMREKVSFGHALTNPKENG